MPVQRQSPRLFKATETAQPEENLAHNKREYRSLPLWSESLWIGNKIRINQLMLVTFSRCDKTVYFSLKYSFTIYIANGIFGGARFHYATHDCHIE